MGTIIRSRRAGRRGQSLVEFAIVLPVLLALTGITIDASRVYFQWLDLESATRDAAQSVVSDPGLIASGGTYLTGGLNGMTIQTAGSGGGTVAADTASNGVFVYFGTVPAGSFVRDFPM